MADFERLQGVNILNSKYDDFHWILDAASYNEYSQLNGNTDSRSHVENKFNLLLQENKLLNILQKSS